MESYGPRIDVLPEADGARAVSTIYRHWRQGERVVVVASPTAASTEELLRRAEQLGLPTRRASLLDSSPPVRPLRVALLGCGVVGGGVLHHLLARPERFTVVAVAVRDLVREREALPAHLRASAADLLARDADVLVEVAGGLDVERWVTAALLRGIHVVTANKALLAERGDVLRGLARARGVRLLASAAVGGALPALETVSRLARRPGVRALRGVLNGTSSFVLDELARGRSLPAAIAEAQRRGFAEADPTLDLDGSDAAQKLALLAREAFGTRLAWRDIDRRGIDEAAARVAAGGQKLRLVAQATAKHARVAPEPLADDDPLATAEGATCALEITLRDGGVVRLQAVGAGRWPTAESVLADLDDLASIASATEVTP